MITDDQREWLKRRAFQSAPHETCGFIMDDGEIIEIANIHPEPFRGFAMSGADILNKIGVEGVQNIIAIWHTHPKGTTHPSKTDLGAMFQGAIDRNWLYLIATKDEVSQWNTDNYAPKDDSFWESFAQ